MKRLIDFQAHLGDMFNEARFVTFKKPMDLGAYPSPLVDFEKSGFTAVPKADAALVTAMQNHMWDKGNMVFADYVLNKNETTYMFLLPVYPNTSFDEMRGAQALEPRFVPFTSADFGLYTAQMITALTRDLDNGAKGLYIHAALQSVDLDSDPVAAAVTLVGSKGLPVVVYYGGPLDYPDSPLFPIGTKPENTALDKVLALVKKFPDFKFVLVCGPADAAETAKLLDSKEGYPNVYVTTAYQNAAGMQKMAAKFGVDKVLFGTDFPFACPTICEDECRKAFSGDDLHKVLYKNAVDLVNLYA